MRIVVLLRVNMVLVVAAVEYVLPGTVAVYYGGEGGLAHRVALGFGNGRDVVVLLQCKVPGSGTGTYRPRAEH